MIQVYSPQNKDYEKNGDMTLFPKQAFVNVVLNGSWQATLNHPIDAEGRWKYLEEEAVVKMPSFNGDQLFRIRKASKRDSGVTCTMEPIFYDSIDDCFLTDVRPTQKNGHDALNIMLSPNAKYKGESDITKVSTAYYEYKNFMEALNGDNEQSFINRWGGEILFDNFTVIVNERVGGDYGVELLYGKNIKRDGLTEEVDTRDVITRIYPVAFNGRKPTYLYVDSENIGKYPTVRQRTMKFENVKLAEDLTDGATEEDGVTICSTPEQLDAVLLVKCQEQFASGIDKPKVTITADMILLQNTEQYKDFQILETVSLGDTIHCKHGKLDIVTDARVIELEYDSIRKKVTSVVLGDFKYDYFDDISSSADKIEQIVRPNGTVMAEKVRGILNAMNTQLKYQKDVAQKQDVRAILFEDLDPDSNTYGAMCLGTQGFQISNKRTADGRDWDWSTAATAKGLNAATIIAGLLSDKTGKNFWNLDTGEFQISAISDMEIGGRNLTRDSECVKIWYCSYGNNTTSSVARNGKTYTVNGRTITNPYQVSFVSGATGDMRFGMQTGTNEATEYKYDLSNKTYTMSVWVMADKDCILYSYVTRQYNDSDGASKAHSLKANTWTRITQTRTFSERADIDGIRVRFTCGTTTNIVFCLGKVEKGNKATDWSPAPEDMESRMSSAEVNIKANANGLTSTVKKGSVSSEISQEAEKVTIKGNRLVVEADNFKLKENGDLEVRGKYTAKFLRRYDKNSFTAEEVTRARKIVAGYQYDDVTEEELAKYDLTGDGLKLNDAVMIARIASGYFDWIEYGTEIEINPLGNAAALKAKVTQQSCVNGVVNEKVTLGETKISGAGMKIPTLLADSYETTKENDWGEIIEYSGQSGTFTTEDGQKVECINGIITSIWDNASSVQGFQRMIAVDSIYGYFDAGAYATVEKTTTDSLSSKVHAIALAYRNAGYTIEPRVLSGSGDYGNAHYYNVSDKTFNDSTYTVELDAKVTNITNSTRTIKVLFRIGLFAYKS